MRCDDNPPKAEAYCYPIVRCRPRYPLNVTILQRKVTGIWTHFWNGKTVACTGPKFCEACKVNVKDIWAGYIIARRHDDDQRVICALTRPTFNELEIDLSATHALFGLRTRLIRIGQRKTSPIKVEFFGRDLMNEEVPKNVMELIMRRLYADNANKATVESR